MAGLLDMLQSDPDKKEALRQGLLSAGIQMLMGGRQGFGESLGQGLGAGVGTYQKEFDATKRKIAMQQSIQAATTPSRPAVPAQYGVQDQRFNTQAEAQSRANPYTTSGPSLGQPEQLMPGMASVMNGEMPEEQPLMSQQQDVSMPGQQVETYPGQEGQAGGFDFSKFAQAALSDPNSPPELQDMAMKYYASQKPAELETVVVGRTLKNKRTGETIGYDETWNDDKIAQREQRMDEIKLRLTDQQTSREQQMELRRELAGQQAALRRDLSEQAAAGRRDTMALGNKPPSGYRYTQNGNLEQIPGGPADLKRQAQLEGGGTVDSVVTSLRDSYNKLDEGGGITSTQNRAGTNTGAWIGSTGIGQTVGSMIGTNNQKERDVIAQQRPLLLQAIMKATGMSAKQMDSNAELKLYLATATDPTKSLQANRQALDMIEKLYGSGAGNESISGNSAAQSKPTTPNSKAVSLSDIAATAKASGKTTEQVTKDFRAKGYQIR